MSMHVNRQSEGSVAAGYQSPGEGGPAMGARGRRGAMPRAPNPRGYIGALGGLGFVVLFMLSAIVSNVAATATYPRPEADAAEVQAYAENPGVVSFLSLAQATARSC